MFELAPPLGSDADEAWRRMLVSRFGTVRPFLKLLVKVVDFGATPESLPVLRALKSLPELTDVTNSTACCPAWATASK